MVNIRSLIETIDQTLDSKRKRHIAGGLLLSMSVMFGGFAITIMTMKGDVDE